jgi:arylsulfatase A
MTWRAISGITRRLPARVRVEVAEDQPHRVRQALARHDRVDHPVLEEELDLFATCAELLGAKLPDNAAEDSVSMLPLLRGGKISAPAREALVNHSAEGRFAIRQGRWKLLLWPGSGGWSPPTPAPSQWLKTEAADLAKLPPFQLYDLSADPAERSNLAAAQPEIVQRLGRLMRRYVEQGRSTPGQPQPVPPVWPELEWMASFSP